MILYGIGGNYSLAGFIGPYSGGTAPVGFWHELIDGRFQGSLGNPAYVAPYLVFSMFFAAYLWIRSKASAAAKTLTYVGYAVLIAIFSFFFILSQTRGAFLGLGAGVGVLVLYFAIAGRGALRKWSLAAIIVLVVVGGGLFSIRNSSFVQRLPEGRLLQISLSDATAQTRFWVWSEAWRGFLDRPVLGWGPENFTAVYDKYFDPRFFVPGQNTETWFDRAHSVFFDYLSETGVVGFLSYLSIFGVFAWEFFKKERESDHSMTTVLTRGLILSVPVAYLVQGVAIFDVLPIYLCLFLFIAFASYYFHSHKTHGQNV
jgi:O-antigen ligase